MSVLRVFVDGGSKGNPGPASIGGIFYLENKELTRFHQRIGQATNNEAEYQALIFALKEIKKNKNIWLRDNSIKKIEFYSDSALLVNQINGFFKVKNNKIRQYFINIRSLEQEINLPITYNLIPREENKVADKLVNLSDLKK